MRIRRFTYLLFGLLDSSKKKHLVFMLKIALEISFMQRFDRFKGIFEFDPVELDLQLFRVVSLLGEQILSLIGVKGQ